MHPTRIAVGRQTEALVRDERHGKMFYGNVINIERLGRAVAGLLCCKGLGSLGVRCCGFPLCFDRSQLAWIAAYCNGAALCAKTLIKSRQP